MQFLKRIFKESFVIVLLIIILLNEVVQNIILKMILHKKLKLTTFIHQPNCLIKPFH